MFSLTAITFVSFIILSSITAPRASTLPQTRNGQLGQFDYRKAHFLDKSFVFNPRDGWESINATHTREEYRRDVIGAKNSKLNNALNVHKATIHINTPKSKNLGKAPQGKKLSRVVNKVVETVLKAVDYLKGFGKSAPVTITWYTGFDLKNPSCWPNTKWAPTDDSFACALTLDGWTTKPKCFEFLELCNTKNGKCVFVRVVDTCAGCKKGSHHVDLTEAPFIAIADSLDVGTMEVMARQAKGPPPGIWDLGLWGPRN